MAAAAAHWNGVDKVNLNHFLDKEIDLTTYFSKAELDAKSFYEKRRLKNIGQNYEVMVYMGLPAVKPEYMQSSSERARRQRERDREALHELQKQAADSSSDEEWTPDMERKRRAREKPKIPHFLKPAKKAKIVADTSSETTRKQPVKREEKKKHAEKRDYELRARKPQNYMDLEPPDDDCFLFCEDCGKEYDIDCPIHGALKYINDTQVGSKKEPDRALHTLPATMQVRTSSIPGAGLGVYTNTDLEARMMFGPYEGVKVTDHDDAHSSGYAWQIYKDGKSSHFIDAEDKSTSNWMRYVNCANSESEQNLVAFQYRGAIYYRSFKAVRAGTELLVWYGEEYGRELGNVRDKNLLIRPSYMNGQEYYPCVFCKTNYTSVIYCVGHLIKCRHGRGKLTSSDIAELDEWYRTKHPAEYAKFRGRHNAPVVNCHTTASSSTVTDDKQYQCNKCNFACNHSGVLKTHMRVHTGENPFKCNKCDFACNESGDLKTHMRIHTGEKPFKCNKCDYAFSQIGNVKTHMRIHTGEKPFKCDKCDFACNQSGYLKYHMRTHTGEKPFKCNNCDNAFNNSGNLKRHMKVHTGEMPFKCDKCDYACNRSGDLKRHMRTHTGEKPFKCNKCDFACNRSGPLKRHMRIHTGEKPFKCNKCDFACNRSGHLKYHMRTHTGEKPFKCNKCDNAFNNSGNLKTHMRIHTGEKPFKCDKCNYAFNCSGNLKKHMRIHTGEKPFKCNKCDYACNRSETLKTHMRIHTGEKPFKCDKCDYACSNSGDLQRHMRIHTGEKPFKCDKCDFACSNSGHLKYHMRTHTGEKPFKCDKCDYACSHRLSLKSHTKAHT